MKHLFAPTLAAAIAIALAGTAANAQAAGGADAARQSCAIGYVTGVGGSEQSIREYLSTPERDRYRYVADNPIQCRVSDEGRASNCTGITNLRHEKVSVYDDSDSTTTTVVARIELDHGETYPVIVAVPKQDLQCGE